ncbi:ABC transporter permease [Aestuariivirga sp.]|uniref:ABC transporter permease n=1 Tax=Aestuariivirga sp. TaxID=2650926 RepID=UPI003BAB11DA
MLFYMLAPLLFILPMALTSGNTLQFPTPGVSFRWFAEIAEDDRWRNSLQVSLIIGAVSTLLALVFGIPAAIGLAWAEFPGKKLVWAVISLPIVMPVVIVGVASYYFFSRIGMVGSRWSIIMVHTAMAVPIVVFTVSASLTTFDRTLLRASASLGAGTARTFLQIMLPLIAPGVVTGAIIAFIISFDEVVVASFLSVGDDRTLPRMIFSGVRESVSPAIAAVALLLMGFSAILLAGMGFLQTRAQRFARRNAA